MKISATDRAGKVCLIYDLIKTTRRLTFDIHYQALFLTNPHNDEVYLKFRASNGYEIFSRSRMDIQTDRIWLFGCAKDERSIRSGTMTFSSCESRDAAFDKFNEALAELCLKGWDNA